MARCSSDRVAVERRRWFGFALVGVALGCNVDAVVADDDNGLFGSGETAAATSGGSTGAVADTSGADESSAGASTTGGTTSTTTALDDGPKLDVAADTESVELGCSEEAPSVIYVMLATTPTEIWSYDPVANDFEWYATVDCDEVHGYFTGFALERSGDILLLSLEPEDPAVLPNPAMQLTRFDPGSGSCEVAFYGGMSYSPMGLGPFGTDCADVAFVSEPDDPDHERLFAHSCTGGGFAVAPLTGPMYRMDLDDAVPEFEYLDVDDYTSVALAGTGDGRLYGVGGDQKVPGVGRILEYDQDNGALLSTTVVPELDIGEYGAYIALAFYAGDLYTFGAMFDGTGVGVVIRRYDLDDDDGNGTNEVTIVDPPDDLPAGIFAAASPTCIPVTPEG